MPDFYRFNHTYTRKGEKGSREREKERERRRKKSQTKANGRKKRKKNASKEIITG